MFPNNLQNEIILFNFIIYIISSYNYQAMYLGFSIDLVVMGHAVTLSSLNRLSRQRLGQRESSRKPFLPFISPLSLSPNCSQELVTAAFLWVL